MTTDETTHLRALLAEQTARAEKAESYAGKLEIDVSGFKGTISEQVDRIHTEMARAEKAEAACAEMRAALEGICANRQMHEYPQARAILARTDLGAGMVVVPGPLDTLVDNLVRVVCDCHDGSDLWAHTRRDPEAFRRTVRDALLKQGGG